MGDVPTPVEAVIFGAKNSASAPRSVLTRSSMSALVIDLGRFVPVGAAGRMGRGERCNQDVPDELVTGAAFLVAQLLLGHGENGVLNRHVDPIGDVDKIHPVTFSRVTCRLTDLSKEAGERFDSPLMISHKFRLSLHSHECPFAQSLRVLQRH